MKTFTKYLFKEFFLYSFSFFCVFSFLITLIKGVFFLEKIVELNLSLWDTFKVFIFIFLEFFPYILPLASLLGILFAIQRIKEDHELLGFLSLGFSFMDFLKISLLFSLFIYFITFFSTFYLLPFAKREKKLTKLGFLRKKIEQPFPSKQFISLGKHQFIYAEKALFKKNYNKLAGILLIERKSKKKGILIAGKGEISFSRNNLFLENGWGFFLNSGKKVEILHFKKYFMKLNLKKYTKPSFSRGELSFSQLKEKIKKLSPGTRTYCKYLSEYYQRFLYPFSAILLILQGFILGYYFKFAYKSLLFFTGISFYLLFYILYDFFLSLGENCKISPLYSFLLFFSVFSLFTFMEYLLLKKYKTGWL